MPHPPHVTGSGFDPLGVVYVVIVCLVMFAPVLFARRRPPSAEDGGSDDPGGRGPRRRPFPPSPPIGGPPLADADQSDIRLRDHSRLADRSRRPWRRYVHVPQRRRQRTSA